MEEPIILRPMDPADWEAVAEIYREGIATGNSTFETDAPTWAEWDAGHLTVCRLVAVAGGTVCGWACLSPISRRAVYSGVAEVSVYIAARFRGKGVGRRLLETLVTESETRGLWMLQAGIFPENTASIALHERFGFRLVGRRERIGFMNGRWRDVLLLERRSTVAGQGTP
jgi:phosphinothricin acetyltransferase